MTLALVCLACVLAGPLAGTAAAAPPVNTLAPEVTGEPEVGQPLVCYPGSWDGQPSFTYIWLRDGQEVQVGQTYPVTSADRGYYISCLVIASNGVGEDFEEVVESENSFLIPGEHGTPPHDEVLPEISPSSGTIGTKLTCSQGSWSGNPAPTFTYQWFQGETAIPNATSSSYTLGEADSGYAIDCKVTGTNPSGFQTVTSKNSVTVAGSKLENTVKPTVEPPGSSRVGESLTCNPGRWKGSPPPTFKYEWLRDKTIKVGTAGVYTVASEDEGHSLSCKVTAENSEGKTNPVESTNSVKVEGAAPHNTKPPEITGTIEAERSVTCNTGTWTGTPTPEYSYQWLREGATVGSTGSTYHIPSEDRGEKISCQVTGKNEEGSETVSSPEYTVPLNSGSEKPHNTKAPSVVGIFEAEHTVTCEKGTWTGKAIITYAYQWRLNKANIPGAVNETFDIETADDGGELSCLVTASNSEGSVPLETTAEHVKGIAPIPLAPPKILGTPIAGATLTCTSGEWEAEPAPTYTYQWLKGGSPVGATDNYEVKPKEGGQTLTCKVTASNGTSPAGEASAQITIPGNEPRPTQSPEITGILKVGEPLTCVAGPWSGEPAPALNYQWLLEGVPISTATRSEYEITLTDAGRSISCEVTGTNSVGSDSIYSRSVKVQTGPPKPVPGGTPVEVVGAAVVGETLVCSRGTWEAKPAAAFSYQWLRNGTVIAYSEGYKVELGDQGHTFSCIVTATNPEGSTTAASTNVVTIPAAVVKSKPEIPVTPPSGPALERPTPAEILSRLSTELAAAQRGAKIGSLLKDGATWFHFTAPTSGTLALSWYEVPKGAHVSSAKGKPQPVLVATTTASFSGTTLKTLELHVTRAGRALLKQSKRITLTDKAVFARPGKPSVTWIKAFVLTR